MVNDGAGKRGDPSSKGCGGVSWVVLGNLDIIIHFGSAFVTPCLLCPESPLLEWP